MSPPPPDLVAALLKEGRITPQQAELAATVPMSHDVCVEADSGGHTDQAVALAVLPSIQALRDSLQAHYKYAQPIRVGLAGGIGTPQAIAAAFTMGAAFVMTGSINQCTVEAGTSDAVKDMLQAIDVQDTDYAPAGDMFEIGARVQVLRKGVFFPARANKLYELYKNHASLEDIPPPVRTQLEQKYFGRTFDAIWQETRSYLASRGRHAVISAAEAQPKARMAWVFKWYFRNSAQQAMAGNLDHRVDFQVHTGPAMGAFNQWVKGTRLENWRARKVADIGEVLMQSAAQLLTERVGAWLPHANAR
jgi:trans-AT polyketide synthase/acyltransferase/oxidoreductase domain-containing protein